VGIGPGRGAVGEQVRQEQNYFAGQAERMNDQALAERGWPSGSGAVGVGRRAPQRSLGRTRAQ